MMLKAGLIVAVFMHMAWERLALVYAILLPPVAGAGVRGDHGVGADYTLFTRLNSSAPGPEAKRALLSRASTRRARAP